MDKLSLDTDRQVFFYEQDHYYLSNFSAFNIKWGHLRFDTSERVYQFEKFSVPGWDQDRLAIQDAILAAPSAHEAFKIAQTNTEFQRPDWSHLRVPTMRKILHTKVQQHEYVRRKLLETGDRELIENSWRDDYWGWGPNRDGQNMLGKLWMEVRAELQNARAA